MAGRHRLFTTLLAGGCAVRLAAVVAYHPALYYNDSYEYVAVALRPQPYVVRPFGYSLLLVLLEPFHSLRLVVLVQHLMGLAIGVIVYALLRRYAVPAVLAAAAAGPQLLDGHQIQLEHLVLSETLFTFLTVAAAALLLWWRSTPAWAFGLAGALFAAASLTRVVGLPLALVALGWLFVRRVDARHMVAFAAALAIPLASYAGWYRSVHGSFEITGSSGIFLYSRTMSFADCSRLDPPTDLAMLCTNEPPDDRQPPSNYIWHPDAPLHGIPGPTFSPYKDALAQRFAVRAILAQPVDYVRVVTRDLARTFGSRITDYPTWDLARHYRFQDQPVQIQDRTIVAGGTVPRDLRAYEHGDPTPHAERPLAGWLVGYQEVVAVPGPVLGLLLFAPAGVLVWAAIRRRTRPPAAGTAAAERGTGTAERGTMTAERGTDAAERGADRREGRAGAPTAALALVVAAGFTLLAVPPMTAGFDHRYVPPALAFLGAAGALAVQVSRPPRDRSTPPAPLPRTTAPERSG